MIVAISSHRAAPEPTKDVFTRNQFTADFIGDSQDPIYRQCLVSWEHLTPAIKIKLPISINNLAGTHIIIAQLACTSKKFNEIIPGNWLVKLLKYAIIGRCIQFFKNSTEPIHIKLPQSRKAKHKTKRGGKQIMEARSEKLLQLDSVCPIGDMPDRNTRNRNLAASLRHSIRTLIFDSTDLSNLSANPRDINWPLRLAARQNVYTS